MAYLGHGLEAMWLLAAVVIPLIVVPQDSMLGYLEIPKSAALKSIAAITAILWLAEWALVTEKPVFWSLGFPNLRSWLHGQPIRWVLLTLGLFLAAYILGTISSVSPAISFWGIKPESDGLDLYSVLSYSVIFLALVTHMEKRAQLWRLFGALIFTGVFIGFHNILQHYNIDPVLGSIVTSQDRTSSTLGNPIVAGAILVMTSTLTLAWSTLLQQRYKTKAVFWGTAIILTIQIVGMVYTFSRGPWVGMAVGLGVFIAVLWLAAGRQQAIRAGMTLATAIVLSIIVVFAGDLAQSSQSQGVTPTNTSTEESVTARAFSVYTEVSEGGLSGRMSIWRSALQVIGERPWFDFMPLPNAWVRQILGYGPDMFRYVIPLRTSAGATAAVPTEAHNFPLQMAVDLGILGFLSLVAIAAAVLMAGYRELIVGRRRSSNAYLIILAGLFAALVGKGVEMTVGIPKMSDLTILAIILAMFVSVHRILAVADASTNQSTLADTSPEEIKPGLVLQTWPYVRTALAIAGILAIGTVTWLKTVNYAWADGVAASAVARFEDGDLKNGMDLMKKASDLAPDVPAYHIILGKMLANIGDSAITSDLELSAATASYKENIAAMNANPLDAEARAAAANAALILGRLDQPVKLKESVALYEQVVDMLPNFAVSHYAAAFAYLVDGEQPIPALRHIKIADSLYKPEDNRELVAESDFLMGGAQRQLGNVTAAIQAFESSLLVDPDSQWAKIAHRHLFQLYAAIGDQAKSKMHAALAQ